MNSVLDDLSARGLIHNSTDLQALGDRLDQSMMTLYCGFDPTADSLHVGNLLALLLLQRFQRGGHRPLVLAGGATGMIGDPSGRDAERTLLDEEAIRANIEGIRPQLERFVDFDAGNCSAVLVNNADWTAETSVVAFLRDVGKHFSINTMLAKDAVKSRMDRDTGISFTEFSYSLLQANDFVVLNKRFGCELQVAGSDQWGNIVAGIDLARRQDGTVLHGLTAPLVTSSDGKKFGKSVGGGGLWLDPSKTSPFQLYQYFVNCSDDDVEPWLKMLTLTDLEEVSQVSTQHQQAPHLRSGQRFLAGAVTSLVHGVAANALVERASEAIFGQNLTEAAPDVFELLESEVPCMTAAVDELDDLPALFARAFDVSKGQVRKNSAGYTLNSVQFGSVEQPVSMILHGRWLVLRKGKASYHLVVVKS